jgi:hypothetical protein
MIFQMIEANFTPLYIIGFLLLNFILSIFALCIDELLIAHS